MFPQLIPRPSARSPFSRAASDTRKVIDAPPPPASGILRFQTIEDVDWRFTDFLRQAEGPLCHSPDTVRGYKGTYGNFRQFLLAKPDVPISARLLAIDEWLLWNRTRTTAKGKRLRPVTVNTYYRQLRPFFKDLAARDGILDPFLQIPRPKPGKVEPKFKSPQECQQILRTAEHRAWPSSYERWRAVAIFGVMLYAGLRKSEVLKLDADDVHLDLRTMSVDGKGAKERTVAIAPELHAILARYAQERRIAFGNDAGAGFFLSTKTGQGISMSTLLRIVDAVRRASGIPFSIHSLRHSFVTTALLRAVPIHVVQQMAGHAKITTTAMYIGLTSEDKLREMQKLSFKPWGTSRTSSRTRS